MTAEPREPLSPLQLTGSLLGTIVALGYLAELQPWRSGEGAEWLAYVAAGVLCPLVALAAPRLPAAVRRGLVAIVVLHVAWIVYANAVSWSDLLTVGVTRRVDRFRLFRDPRSAYFAVPLVLFTHVPTWFLTPVLTGVAATRPWYRAFSSESFVFALLASFAALTLLTEPGFWWQFESPLPYLLFPVGIWLTWKAWSDRTSAAPKTLRRLDACALVAFVLWTLTPLYSMGAGALNHWSFYTGPIDLVKHGHLLLHDVPSQYGFLSVLLPAALPWSDPALCLHLVFAVLILGQAVLTYRLLAQLSSSAWARGWALVCTFVTVYLSPGAQLLGRLAYPSTAAYRFFWVLAVAWVLIRRPRSRPLFLALLSSLAALGILWSVESAIYVAGTLAVVTLAEALVLTANGAWRGRALHWCATWAGPLAATLALVAVVELVYRLGSGVAPDWRAFPEFALSYGGGFGALAVNPLGAVSFLALAVAAVLAFGAAALFRSRDPGDAGLLAPFGACAATSSYFISRSHDSNIHNLAAFWFALLFLLFLEARRRGDERWTSALRAVVCPLAVVMITLTLSLSPAGFWRLRSFFRWPDGLSRGYFPESGWEWSPLPVLELVGDAPVQSLGDDLQAVTVAPARYRAWLPAYPWRELRILSPERQALYVDRFVARSPTPVGYLVRELGYEERESAFDAALERHYQRVEERMLDARYRLEKYVRR